MTDAPRDTGDEKAASPSDHRVIELSDAEYNRVVELTERPAKPTPLMCEVWDRYEQLLQRIKMRSGRH